MGGDNNMVMILAVVIIVLLLIGAAVYVTQRGNGKSSTPPTAPAYDTSRKLHGLPEDIELDKVDARQMENPFYEARMTSESSFPEDSEGYIGVVESEESGGQIQKIVKVESMC